ncbi:PIN domain-containing protein [Pantoea sp.]|uniref:PIN domain-containing protein n=1 Tax=Pantoea sp. TaxID=69393 RepID=UPI0028A60BE6|nr:PIN domain-containing protein [Pantoea sp.]
MLILISDANILIDLEEGELIRFLFHLPYQFTVPDLLFYDELAEHHAYLLEQGLHLGEMTPETLRYVSQLVTRFQGPSRYDCFALALARQEKCPLLTGDKALRLAAQAEQVEVRGTLWLVEEMVRYALIDHAAAHRAYLLMRASGRRLPWDRAFQGLSRDPQPDS